MEADLLDIFGGPACAEKGRRAGGGRYRLRAHGNAVPGTLLFIVVALGMRVLFCLDRRAACRFVGGLLDMYQGKEEEAQRPA